MLAIRIFSRQRYHRMLRGLSAATSGDQRTPPSIAARRVFLAPKIQSVNCRFFAASAKKEESILVGESDAEVRLPSSEAKSKQTKARKGINTKNSKISSSPKRKSSVDAEQPDQTITDESDTSGSGASKPTPAMEQWLEMKAAHPGFLLLFRLGDFYEMFYDDAARASQVLGIALTRRGSKSQVPMAGVPAHSLEHHLDKLIRAGLLVAVCEQDATPARRGAIMRRHVTRLVTPGTLTDERLLPARAASLLAAACPLPDSSAWALAWADASTGRRGAVRCSSPSLLAGHLARLAPAELLLPPDATLPAAAVTLVHNYGPASDTSVSATDGTARVTVTPPVAFSPQHLERGDAALALDTPEATAAGALAWYLRRTLFTHMPGDAEVPLRLAPVEMQETNRALQMDVPTRRSLELNSSWSSGERRGSLLAVLDRTVTPAGARLLVEQLNSPLQDLQAISNRLDAVQWLRDRPQILEGVREHLRGCFDVERALQRVSLQRGGPRDLTSIASSLLEVEKLLALFPSDLPAELAELRNAMADPVLAALATHLDLAMAPDPPATTADGEFIAKGYSKTLDELRRVRDEHSHVVASLLGEYKRNTSLPGLKLRNNLLLGYYLEVPVAQSNRVPAAWQHVQTMPEHMRYRTKELEAMERKLKDAEAGALTEELRCFSELVAEVLGHVLPLRLCAHALARLDVHASHALVATQRRYVRPVVDDSHELHIVRGRHPVVEAAQQLLPGTGRDQQHATGFTANDTQLTAERARLWLVTGPNMGGKSTFLRQAALLTIMAHAGSFVPADAMRVGRVDAVFSRVGAADDLANDRSTFMVEMSEVGHILRTATARSMVIMDEVGRGTGALDGLAVAWAVLEHLHNVTRCRALFATHYLQLATLKHQLPALACYTTAVRSAGERLVFLHQLVPGEADRSYGVHCAQLAGLPAPVVRRAASLLSQLEQHHAAGPALALPSSTDDHV